MSPENSTLFIQYNEGVKMGCWCLLSFAVVSALSAGKLEKNIKDFLVNFY